MIFINLHFGLTRLNYPWSDFCIYFIIFLPLWEWTIAFITLFIFFGGFAINEV